MYSPWSHLASRHPHVNVRRRHLTCGSHALTDGTTIWLDENLPDVDVRCALTHEIIHIEWGHAGEQDPTMERSVRFETARRLVPFEWLWATMRWTVRPTEAAAELGVTEDVLMDRFDALTETELQTIRDRMN